jgi:TonB-dependent SusC/RagA subfamily outer membrane receptor
MRKYILVAIIIAASVLTSNAQSPQLTVDGKTNNGVQLQALKIEIKVCGTVARTTWQMTFKNTTSKILEGTLNFPLKDGLSVSRYALDINGKMREAVPVDRGKGTEVFETIERRRVDPGLLEKIDGNTFRTRIYPINANSTRTVIIGYEEELPVNNNDALQYYLPLNLKDTVTSFNLDVSVIQTATQPVFDAALNENIHFTNTNNTYNSSLQKTNYVPGYSLSFSIPKPMDAAEVMLQEFENNYYYLINTRLQKNEREKIMPSTVALLWDASLSGSNRNIKKEMELLDVYFKKINNVTVNLAVFSNTIKTTKTFLVQNGNWAALKEAIEIIQYDGATNFGSLNLKNIKADEFILVSDGHQTLGNKQMQLSNKPVYCINSAAAADYSNLKFIALKTGGLLIDLQNTSAADAIKKLMNEPFRFLGIKQNNLIKENYPFMPVAVNGNFAVAGIAEEGVKEIILQFGYGNTVTYEKTIIINRETQLCENFDITKIFAQKKIAELDIQYNQNKNEIERLGKQFGIVTRNTSLIVLETINDYVQYEIEPPAELKEEYNRIMKQRSSTIITKNENDLRSTLNMIATIKDWYNQKVIKNEVIKKEPLVTAPPIVRPQVQRTSTTNARVSGNTKIITGRIVDNTGQAVPFASIKIKGTTIGMQADASGNFRLSARQGNVLQSSAVGFNTAEVMIGPAATINITIEKTSADLQKVVVVGYSTQRRRDVIGSVQTISADRLETVSQQNIVNSLAGKVAGVQVTSSYGFAGASTSVQIRGQNSFRPSAGTLYVVDGVTQTSINHIDQKDIATIDVLKDENATAIFGAVAANGAVIITTKNFKPDSLYKKIQDKIETENIAEEPAKPNFNIEIFDYLKEIKLTEKANRYIKYLTLRQYYITRPTYFFDVATYFLKTGDKANGLTILSNLAELENGSYELYKMLGYKLKEAGEYEGELSAFKKVKELRPNDPQSYRDCALAYLDLGNYQQALDMLYEGMTKSYSNEMDRMYSGIEEIFLTEINSIIALYKNELNLKNIDKKIIIPMPSDVRVVMNWNMNNTDIDLWVTDPNGEKCFYSHKTTAMGGRISDDFTEGFGPEQFLLKTGAKGKYKIQIDYYSDTQATLAGPTTIMAEIYLHYGTTKEVKKIVTLLMQKEKEGEVFIGEVEL